MTGHIIQVGDTNIFVNTNYGNINVSSGRQIQKELTAIPFVDENSLIGRAPIMLEIRRILVKEKGRKIVQLHGIGGIGKTTLAEHFLVNNKSRYDHMAYVEDNSSIVEALGNNLQLADSLVLNEDIKGKSIRKKFDLVISRMRQLKGRNLLIIDNTTEQLEHSEIYNSVNLTNDWDVMVTSREPLQNCAHIRVPEMNKEHCRELFYKHYHFEKNDKVVDEILQVVDYHTLTIEVVAMTSERRIFDLKQILETVKKKSHTFQNGQPRELRFAGAAIAT